jgi:hypothetical protein
MAEGLELHVDLQSAAQVVDAFERAPEIATEELTRAAWEASLLIQREAQENTPIGVGSGGGLRGSISARTPRAAPDGVIGVVGSPLNYAAPVEFGTRPHMPPVQPLAEWAQAKLGLSPEEARGAGFAIARKIARKGTEGAHMFGKALESTGSQVQRIFANAAARMTTRITAEGAK